MFASSELAITDRTVVWLWTVTAVCHSVRRRRSLLLSFVVVVVGDIPDRFAGGGKVGLGRFLEGRVGERKVMAMIEISCLHFGSPSGEHSAPTIPAYKTGVP
jgi:hypothetical protein